MIKIIITAVITFVLTTSYIAYERKRIEAEEIKDMIKKTENCKSAPTPFACEW